MHYILDGNNIIKNKRWNRGNQKLDDRQALVIFVEQYCRHHPSIKFTIVFDGWSDCVHSTSNVKILWSYDITADEIIIKKIPLLGKDAIVVSNDNQIRKKVKFAGIKTLSVEEFLEIMEPPTERKQTQDKKIPYKHIPAIRNELEKYYEEHQPETDSIRKIRKRLQRFF